MSLGQTVTLGTLAAAITGLTMRVSALETTTQKQASAIALYAATEQGDKAALYAEIQHNYKSIGALQGVTAAEAQQISSHGKEIGLLQTQQVNINDMYNQVLGVQNQLSTIAGSLNDERASSLTFAGYVGAQVGEVQRRVGVLEAKVGIKP